VTADAFQELAAAIDDPSTEPRRALVFQTIADLCAEVDAAGPRKWLIRGVWPAGAYGVHAAEMKAQKTWNALDLAVSVASGTPWLAFLAVDEAGPVLIFAGEGGKGEIVRRLRAICLSRSLDLEQLPIVVCARAPHLSSTEHLALFDEQLEVQKPALVVLDPLYLAARGAKGSDLYAMGELLEQAQLICAKHAASLFCVTHYNRKEGNGPGRFTGAGPAEWGRVLIGARIVSRHTDADTLATSVIVELEIVGGEIPDQTVSVRRDIRSEDPSDLDAPLDYRVERISATPAAADSDLPPAAAKLLEALEALDEPSTGVQLVDWIVDRHGHGLKRETVSRHLNALKRQGTVECTNPDAAITEAKLWRRVTNTEITRDHTAGDVSVTAVISPKEITRNGHTTPSHHNGDHARGGHEQDAWLASLDGLAADDDPPASFLDLSQEQSA
jgi:hypothetical protein